MTQTRQSPRDSGVSPPARALSVNPPQQMRKIDGMNLNDESTEVQAEVPPPGLLALERSVIAGTYTALGEILALCDDEDIDGAAIHDAALGARDAITNALFDAAVRGTR